MKKFLCLILSTVMLACAYSLPTVFAEEAERVYKENGKWKTCAELVAAIGVLEGYHPEDYSFTSGVSRAEFVSTIVNFYGLQEYSKKDTGFADVPSTYWAAGEIAFAGDMGLISTDSPLFYPDREITLNEAVKIAVGVLGYSVMAETKGGYPAGYLAVAGNLGLLNGQSSGESFLRGDMVCLFYQMLDAKILEINVSDGTNDEYTQGEKLLESLDIYRIKDVVRANNFVALDGASTTSKGEILVGDIRLLCDNSNALIGRKVDCFYKYDKAEDAGRVIYMKCIDDGALKIESGDIISIKSDAISYITPEDDIEKIALNKNIEMIYNGRKEISLPTDLFVPKVGWLELTDYDGDGEYDILVITSFQEYVVNGFNKRDKIVYDKIDRSREFDFGKNFKKLEVYLNGEEANVDDIAVNMVLSVAESRDGDIVTVYANGQTVNGKASEIGDDYIVIEEKEYRFTEAFVENDYYDVSLNSTNVYYLNAFGSISYAKNAGVKNYGYLMGIEKDSGLGKIIKVKMLNNEGKITVYSSGDKIKLNGRQINSDKVLNSSTLFVNGEFKQQLCTYTLNDENIIKQINVAGSNEDPENELVLNHDSGESTVTLRSYKTSAMMLNKYLFEGSTKVFLLSNNERDMMVSTPSTLTADTAYKVKIYDFEDCVVGAAVIDNTTGSAGAVGINTESGTLVVSDVMRSVDEETGEEITKIYAYQDGKMVDIYPEDDEVKGNAAATLFPNVKFSELQKGDVLQPATGTSGRISSFRLIFGMKRGMNGLTEVTYTDSAVQNQSGQTGEKYAKMFNLYGQVTGVYSENIITINTALGTNQSIGEGQTIEDFERTLRRATGAVYLYDTKKDKVSRIEANEIAVGDMVYARVRYVLTEEIYVVR